jgi:hypothetical protein
VESRVARAAAGEVLDRHIPSCCQRDGRWTRGCQLTYQSTGLLASFDKLAEQRLNVKFAPSIDLALVLLVDIRVPLLGSLAAMAQQVRLPIGGPSKQLHEVALPHNQMGEMIFGVQGAPPGCSLSVQANLNV